MSSGIEEMEVELNAGGCRRVQDFSLCIAKISQGLRKFRNHRENFTILTNFRYAQFFAMIAKFRYDSEIDPPLFLIQTTSFCVIPILSPM